MSELLNPFLYAKKLDKEKKERIQEIRALNEDEKRRARNRASEHRSQLQDTIRGKGRIDQGSYTTKGCIAGAIVGLFPCIPTSNQGNFSAAFFTWIIFIALGGAFMYVLARSMKDTTDLESQIESSLHSEAATIKKLEESLCGDIETIEADIEQKKTLHEEEFGKFQRESSLKFVGSPITQEIVSEIVNPFKLTIESSNRSPHVKTIRVPLAFKVYINKVETPYGTYDFTLQRVENLHDINEAAALANAVATAVHTDIVSSYPIDPSGGEVTPMDVSYEYSEYFVRAEMTYLADNANYKQARSF